VTERITESFVEFPRKRIYLAGPITGDPDEHSFVDRYARAVRMTQIAAGVEGILVATGEWVVKNPFGSVLCSQNWRVPHETWMLQACAQLWDIHALLTAGDIDEGAICLLPGWETSKGACKELDYAYRELELEAYIWIQRSNGDGKKYIGELQPYAGGDA